jgi:hypothetical protein
VARGGGFFSRVANFVREIFTTEEPQRERVREVAEPPESHKRTPRRSRPDYDPDSDSWNGISARDWQRISDIAHSQLGSGASFNANVGYNRNGLFITDDKPTDLRAIIEALESGRISSSDMIALLRYRESAARDVAYSQDTRRGQALWNNRISGVAEELYWYQWGW